MPPDAVLRRLIEILPGFGSYWDLPDNYSRDEDGGFSLCGVFTECSHFAHENYEQLTVRERAELARFIGDCMIEPGSFLDEAAATCFLENLTFEPYSEDFMRHLEGEARSFYRGFQGL